MESRILFESRKLNPWADFARAGELREGAVYFHVSYRDDDMLVPYMEPLVFVGRNLEPDVVDRAYFQDLDSYQEGMRFSNAVDKAFVEARWEPLFQSFQEKHGQVMAVYEFELALEELMRCSLKRREQLKNAK